MAAKRESGVLLHPTSLPGGRLGAPARAFVDWLAAAGQAWWQILPLGPPDEAGSPYAAQSAFAGWPGLLEEPEAPVSAEEIESFVAAHPYWTGAWAAYVAPESADHVSHPELFQRGAVAGVPGADWRGSRPRTCWASAPRRG